MAKLKNGILWPPEGSIGPNLYRRRKNGTTIVVPRFRRDKRSQAQLVERDQFRRLTKLLSSLYPSYIKPYARYWALDYTPFAEACKFSLPYWLDFFRWPYVLLQPYETLNGWAPRIFTAPALWRVYLDFENMWFGTIEPGSIIRVFFLYGRPGYLLKTAIEIAPLSGSYRFDIPVIDAWSYVYIYCFANKVDRYGIFHKAGHCALSVTLGTYNGVPW